MGVHLSHVFWVVLQTAYELCDWVVLEADLVDSVEQGEPGETEGEREGEGGLLINRPINIRM